MECIQGQRECIHGQMKCVQGQMECVQGHGWNGVRSGPDGAGVDSRAQEWIQGRRGGFKGADLQCLLHILGAVEPVEHHEHDTWLLAAQPGHLWDQTKRPSSDPVIQCYFGAQPGATCGMRRNDASEERGFIDQV
eukprot:11229-Pyramimonas_sp.AAC.1